jgi:tetratricopeptide (TPR) repeat protein
MKINTHSKRLLYVVGLLTLSISSCSQKALPTGEKTSDGRLAPRLKNLGDLNAPITTKSPEAQGYFNQGLTLVYAFNHAEALRSFKEAARLDPDCAMAYWGQALALAPNTNDPAIGPDREQQGFDAMAESTKRRSQASPREQALIDALGARFSGVKDRDRQSLNNAYAEGMAKAHKSFPEDADVASLYADAVMNTMPWNYWAKGKPKPGIAESRAALEQTLLRQPNHAGANHLYIHLMEASDDVDLTVPSADRLAGLVPAAGHLVHMPAHTYIRVGRYADAAAVNVKAIAADEDYITQCRAQGIYPAAYYPHNIHFLNAVLAMDGRRKEALESAQKLATRHDHAAMSTPGFAFVHVLKTIPVITMVRFGQWDDVLKEPEPSADMTFGRAMRHFGRGSAYSATGKPREAKEELVALKKLAGEKALADLKINEANPLSKLAEISVAMLEGEISQAGGAYSQAATAFRKAVQIEDDLIYSEPPDWALSPRPYLGNALLAGGRLPQAEQVYREDLKRHRANGWSLFGLEQCLRKQGKAKEADQAKADFQKAWARADVRLTRSRF